MTISRYSKDDDGDMYSDRDGKFCLYKEVEPILKDAKRFIEILDIRETSDSGRDFSPITIDCCRVMLGIELSNIINRLKENLNG